MSSAAELISAVQSAEGGERILLAPGDYGALELNAERMRGLEKLPAVTIVSADAERPAMFRSIYLRGVRGIVIDSVMLDYEAKPGASTKDRAAQVIHSRNVAIRNTVFDGDLAKGLGPKEDGYGTGFALVVEGTRELAIEDNVFYNFTRGAVFGAVDDLVVSGNDLHFLRSDGMDFAQVTNVLIENNYLHDFAPSIAAGDHPDMIQFWTTNTQKPSTDITIRGNIFDSNKGSWTQTLFMRNELTDVYGAGPEMFYRNIVITDNVIRNAHAHGIFVGETDGLVIKNNTVIHNATTASGSTVNIPRIRVVKRARNVEVTHNVAFSIAIETPDAVVSDNLLVQRESRSRSDFLGKLTIDGLADQGDVRTSLRAVPGGLIETRGLGAAMLRGGAVGLLGRIDAQLGAGEQLQRVSFGVAGLRGPEGPIAAESITSIAWDFGDGASGEGLTPSHDYVEGGRFVVRASVSLDDGRKVAVTKTVDIATPLLVSEDFDTPMTPGTEPKDGMLVGPKVTFERDASGGKAVRLNGELVVFKRRPEFLNNTEYTLLIDINTGRGGGAHGRLLNFTRSFVVEVKPGGVISVGLDTDKGGRELVGQANLSDGRWHRLRLTFSSQRGVAALYVDGQQIAGARGLQGAIQVGDTGHDLFIGNPWGEGFTGLVDNFQFLRAATAP